MEIKKKIQTAGVAHSPVITLESGLIEPGRLYSVFSEHGPDMERQQLDHNPKTRMKRINYPKTSMKSECLTDACSDTVNQVSKYQWLQTSRSSCQVKRMNSYLIKIKNKHEKNPDLANMSLMCSRKRII